MGGGAELKKSYEFMYIITPEATEEERTAVFTYVENNLKAVEAEDVVVDKIGEKKLAYPIDKKSTGFYVLVKFNVDGERLVDFEKKINMNEKIIRFILVKVEK